MPTLIDRFMDKWEYDGTCWEWRAYRNACGYGVFRAGEKSMLAHRFAYEYYVGDLLEGKEICHKCNNPACVNPDHLYQATHAINMHHASRDGLFGDRSGDRNSNSKLIQMEADAIRNMYDTGLFTQKLLGKMFDVPQTTISKIVRNERWNRS